MRKYYRYNKTEKIELVIKDPCGILKQKIKCKLVNESQEGFGIKIDDSNLYAQLGIGSNIDVFVERQGYLVQFFIRVKHITNRIVGCKIIGGGKAFNKWKI